MMLKAYCKQILVGASLVLPVILTSGCGFTEPQRVERDYGSSVRQMIHAQTLYPEVAAHPDPEPVKSIDGMKAERILKEYRKDVAKPPEVTNIINIGTPQ